MLKKEVFGVKNIDDLDNEQIDVLVSTAKDIIEIIKREVGLVDFWDNYTAQKKLKTYIVSHLLKNFKGDKNIIKNRNAIAQRILELAYHLNKKLVTASG